MKQYELLKEVRNLYLQLKREFILDPDMQVRLQQIPYKGVELYLMAIKIILDEGKTKGELILKNGKKLAKEQKKFYKKKLYEYEKLYNNISKSQESSKNKRKENSWIHKNNLIKMAIKK